jgi:hypothetical protein
MRFICALLLLFTACGEPTILVITVKAPGAGLSQANRLQLDFELDGEHFTNAFFPTSGTTVFSTERRSVNLVIQADGRQGEATFTLQALDVRGLLVAETRGTVTLVAQQKNEVSLTILPVDFEVNTSTDKSQIFSTTAAGRQLASDEAGGFFLLWVDQICPLDRCDIHARVFDSEGQPAGPDFVANGENAYYDMPAITARPNGNYVVAWQGDRVIRAMGFYRDGKATTQDQALSDPALPTPNTPDIVELADGRAVVVWMQGTGESNKAQIFGHTLDDTGLPTKALFGTSIEPFSISTTFDIELNGTYTLCEKDEDCLSGQFCREIADTVPNVKNDICTYACDNFQDSECPNGMTCQPFEKPICAEKASPAASAHDAGGFALAWKAGGNLFARFVSKADELSVDVPLNSESSGAVYGFDIQATESGYTAIWSERQTGNSHSDIRMRRFLSNGEPAESAFQLNTTATRNHNSPVLVKMKSGRLLAAWSVAEKDTPSLTDIRGRMLLSNGLPVGDDYLLTSTISGSQAQPSLAAHAAGGFILAFTDGSQTGTDKSGTSVRARLLFPEYDLKNGKIGALCDSENVCAADLACLSVQDEDRCLARCVSPQSQCPHGGTCQKVGAELSYACLY